MGNTIKTVGQWHFDARNDLAHFNAVNWMRREVNVWLVDYICQA